MFVVDYFVGDNESGYMKQEKFNSYLKAQLFFRKCKHFACISSRGVELTVKNDK